MAPVLLAPWLTGRRGRKSARSFADRRRLELERLEERQLLSSARPLQTFTLQERFGVTHPDQIVIFGLSGPINPQSTYLVGPNGQAVPYQLLSGNRIAVETDLPANATRSWGLYAGTPPAPSGLAHSVTLSQTATYYEIGNGLTGVRIPKVPTSLTNTPAPIQGVRYQDGTWTATGPNYLSASALSMDVQVLESGPLEDVVQVRYSLDRPDFIDAQGIDHPGGVGHYTSIITVQAGQPSVMVREDTDTDVSYALNVYNGLHPNQARYRGHDSTSVANGYQANGQQYQPSHARPPMDAFVDLQYMNAQDFPRMAVWDPWISNSGWYWQLYDKNAPAGGNLVGIFAGPASTALGAGNSGVGASTAPLAVTDLTTQTDASGTLHAVYVSGTDLWYLPTSASLSPGTPQRLGTGLVNADLSLTHDGRVSVVAYDGFVRRFTLIEQDSHHVFHSQQLSLGTSSQWSVTGTYAYGAHSASYDFLLVEGQSGGQQGYLLFARHTGSGGYSFQQFVAADNSRQVARPSFATLADGRVALVYTDQGGYVEVATIAVGARDFGTSASARGLYFNNIRLLNFGAALDPRTGNIFVADNTGALALLKPSGSQLAAQVVRASFGMPLDHSGQGPNRRSLAVDTHGNALAFHGGNFFIFQNGGWSRFTAADALQLANPRVSFDPARNAFLIEGRSNGMLTIYTWQVGTSAPQQVRQLTSTALPSSAFVVEANRTAPDGRFFPEVRFSWGIFTGSKGHDLASPYSIQPIARQMDVQGGINLNKVYQYQLSYPDPPQGYGALYMPHSAVQAMIQRLRTDPAYYQYLYNADPAARDLLAMWADTTGAAVQQAVTKIVGTAQALLSALVSGDGVYDFTYHYWHGGLAMNEMGPWIDSVLASGLATSAQKAQVKAAAALFANVLWDNDFVPMQAGSGLNLGTANMPVQQQNYRDFYALLLSQNSNMRGYAQGVGSRALATVDHIINQYGAEIGSTHYIGASLEPTLNTLLQLRMMGGTDPFSADPRLAKFAEFYLNLLTPAEARFGNQRKVVAIGDAPTESSEIYGLLATGFRTANPGLSARLMGAWVADGKRHSSFFGTTLLKIDETAPAADPRLADANFPGYYSVLRHGWGTANETALWFVNGDFYQDHRHNDQGAISLYALGAPISVNWGSMYSPRTPGAAMQSSLMPASSISWTQGTVPLDQGPAWDTSTQDAFLSFGSSSMAQAHFTMGNTVWTRTAYSLHAQAGAPIILLRDSVANAPGPMALTLNLMAQGGVATPHGTLTPPQAVGGQDPTLGPGMNLGAGVSRFGFTGQWGVDFDVYSVSSAGQEAHIGNWAHNSAPGAEASQYQAATGRSFEERQDILRIKGNGPFQTLLLPYRHGQRPSNLQVRQSGSNLVITANGGTTTVGDTWYAYHDSQQTILTTFDTAPASGNNLSAAGGPVEVNMTSTQATITASGAAGTRTLTLPGRWHIDATVPHSGLSFQSGHWVLSYSGGSPVTVHLLAG